MKFIFSVLLFAVAIGCKNKITAPNQANRKAKIQEDRSADKTDVFCSVPASPTNNTEAVYAEAGSQNTMAEKAFCELAETRATKAIIKSFATKIALEHDTINDTFIQIIIKKRILLIDGLQPKFKKELSKLERTTQAFDHAFLEAILLNYRRSITTYENNISKIDDVELKRDALTMLAVKKVHLTEAQHLMDQID